MAAEPSLPHWNTFSVIELTVRGPQDDLLGVEPLDLGTGQPATAALTIERGPQPSDMRPRGE